MKISIAQLSLDPKNARKHSARNLEAIAASLLKFGQRKPLVVHRGVVLAGNGTLEAARSLGWTEIDVAEVPDDWDMDTAKAYALADNRTAELAEWDESELAKQLLELQDADWDITELGFDIPALADIEPGDEDEIPEPPVEPKTKLGDIYQLGRHRLMCGDSTDEATVNRLMDGVKADMVFTDPPYGVEYTGGMQFKDGKVETKSREMIKNDDVDIYQDVMRVLSEFSNGPCYIWFAGTGYSSDLAMSREKAVLDSQMKLADTLNGALNAMVKQQKSDNAGSVVTDKTSLTVKKIIANTVMTGYRIEDARVVSENRNYRTFILVRYPVGDANRLLKDRLQQQSQSNDSDEALQRELDREVQPQIKSRPVSHAEPAPAPVPVAAAPSPSAVTTVNLLPVDNEEYKARRDAALQKPGAVIGQVTIR